MLNSSWISDLLAIRIELQRAIFETILIVIVLRLIDILVVRIINHKIADPHKRYDWRKMTVYVLTLVGVFMISPLWLADIRSAGIFLGLVSAGLAIALQKPLTNLAGWLFIVIQHPFAVGDRIQINEQAGDVIDIRFFQFTLMEIGNWVEADQSTGRVLHIPNALIFTDAVANFNKGFDYIWNELPIHLTFESDWEKAKLIIQTIADEYIAPLTRDAPEHVKKAANRYLIVYSKYTPIVYTRVEQNGVLLTLRYLCLPRRRRSTEQLIWENLLRAFAQHDDIEFAYPTQRFYHRTMEQAHYPMPPFPTPPRSNHHDNNSN